MKLASASDLHFEQYTLYPNFGLDEADINNGHHADVLVLAGDIMDTSMFNLDRVSDFFERLANRYTTVLYVMGNHEHYDGDFALTEQRLVKFFRPFPNVKVLEKSGVTIGKYRFFGGTMWTDFSNGNPMSLLKAKRAMNDYAWVKNSNTQVHFKSHDAKGAPTFHTRSGKLTPEDVYDDHRMFLRKLQDDLKEHQDKDYVLVTHHSPSYQMCSEYYAGDDFNDLYHSNLDYLFHDNPNIKLAYMGHTHGKRRRKINECEVVLNARGYPDEPTSRGYRFELTELS